MFNKFTVMNNEAQIRAPVADWERAVREKNYDGILAWQYAGVPGGVPARKQAGAE